MLKRLCILACLLAAPACGDSNNAPTAPTATRANITVTASPSNVTATRCNPQCVSTSGSSFPYSTSFVIAVQETAGIGGNIDSIMLSGSTGGGATANPITVDASEIISRSGTNHVDGHGALSFPVELVHSTVPLVIDIQVQFHDNNGNQVTGAGKVNVS